LIRLTEKGIRDLEKKDRIEAVRFNRKKRAIELKAIKKQNSDGLIWVWEFSKKLVLICSVLYVFSFFYSCIVMWKFLDFSCLGTFIEQASDILRTCVFGYFVKAGVENVVKIAFNKTEHNEPVAKEE
jgi:hypothetical protein